VPEKVGIVNRDDVRGGCRERPDVAERVKNVRPEPRELDRERSLLPGIACCALHCDDRADYAPEVRRWRDVEIGRLAAQENDVLVVVVLRRECVDQGSCVGLCSADNAGNEIKQIQSNEQPQALGGIAGSVAGA